VIISHFAFIVADLSADRKSWRKPLFLRRFDGKSDGVSADPVMWLRS
jgi:hypothetical protein